MVRASALTDSNLTNQERELVTVVRRDRSISRGLRPQQLAGPSSDVGRRRSGHTLCVCRVGVRGVASVDGSHLTVSTGCHGGAGDGNRTCLTSLEAR